MKKVRKHLLVIAFVIGLLPVFAQHHLRTSLALPTNDSITVIKDGTFGITLILNNDSAFGFGGIIGVHYKVDTTSYTDSSNTSGLNFSTTYDTIPPLDSLSYSITGTASQPRIKSGPSVVVIWPVLIYNGTQTRQLGDSIKIQVTVIDPTGINKSEPESRVYAYIFENTIYIKSSEMNVKHVRIYNISGQMIQETTSPGTNIPLTNASPGIYIAQLTTYDNKEYTFRFYR